MASLSMYDKSDSSRRLSPVICHSNPAVTETITKAFFHANQLNLYLLSLPEAVVQSQ
jgi:hypothetical protein